MPTIHIQTIPNGVTLVPCESAGVQGGSVKEIHIFQMIQSGRIIDKGHSGFDCEDWINEYAAPNRLHAAIVNFGLAARYLVDSFEEHWRNSNLIIIATDTDGADTRHNGEHNVLYSLLNPHNDYEARKLAGLYQEYKPFLLRAKELIKIGRIRSKLQ